MAKRALIATLLALWFAIAGSAPDLRQTENALCDRNADRICDNLEKRLAEAKKSEKVRVLITFRDIHSSGRLAATGLQRFHNLPIASANLSEAEILSLAKRSDIRRIELDGVAWPTMAEAKKYFGVTNIHNQFGYKGRGIAVAIVDTGILATHPDLAGKVVHWRDFANQRPDPYDDMGHGTCVAGIIAGSGKKTPNLSGVAPEAKLVVYKVFEPYKGASSSAILGAIDDAIANRDRFRIRVMNLSIGTYAASDGNDALSVAAEQAVTNGIFVTASAGNYNAINYYPNQRIGAPGAARQVMTVGAGSDPHEGGFSVVWYSMRGPTLDGRVKPDVWAPGVNLMTTSNNGGYENFGGTSASAPFVAGVAALMLEAQPDLNPGQLKSVLKSTAQPWGLPVVNNAAGRGRIQPYQAMVRLTHTRSNLVDPPDVPAVHSIPLGELTQEKRIAITMTDRRYPLAIVANNFHWPGAAICTALYANGHPLDDWTCRSTYAIISRGLPIARYPGKNYVFKIKPISGTASGHVVISGDCTVKLLPPAGQF